MSRATGVDHDAVDRPIGVEGGECVVDRRDPPDREPVVGADDPLGGGGGRGVADVQHVDRRGGCRLGHW